MTGFSLTGERRDNLDDYALGEFIRHCESGRVKPGSVLVVESADRISRESAVVAINLFTRLLMLGVVVVTLTPEMEYRTDADIGKLITVGVTIDRAHDESRMKHARGKNAWVGKRAGAAAQPLTSLVPGWCRLVGARKVGNRLVGGEVRAEPSRAATVRRLFRMARDGMSCATIARTLNAERTPVVGRASRWATSGVYNILTNPAVMGEFRPHTGRPGNRRKGRPETRKPTGEVVPDYYPTVIDREEFHATQAALQQRSAPTSGAGGASTSTCSPGC
jgi:DNA invertase Pin-like site-specific DNA recombinase